MPRADQGWWSAVMIVSMQQDAFSHIMMISSLSNFGTTARQNLLCPIRSHQCSIVWKEVLLTSGPYSIVSANICICFILHVLWFAWVYSAMFPYDWQILLPAFKVACYNSFQLPSFKHEIWLSYTSLPAQLVDSLFSFHASVSYFLLISWLL